MSTASLRCPATIDWHACDLALGHDGDHQYVCVGDVPLVGVIATPTTADAMLFVVPRRKFYEAMADTPMVQGMARWADRLEAQRREDHDPGDEDRS